MANLINLSNSDIDSDANLDGYDAKDAADNKLGSIDSVIADADTMQPRYLVIDTGGWFSSKKFAVPIGEVSRIDDDDKDVYFRTLTKDMLENGRYPQYDESWWDNNDGRGFSEHELELQRAYRPTTATATTSSQAPADRIDYNSDLYRRPEGARRLQLMEERLQVNKQRYQAGSVQLGKHITEHTETVNVPVREERVVIERTPGDGRPAGDAKLGEGETIEVPVMKERVDVEKQPYVREEVGIRKEPMERQQQVQDTVRREELDVRGDENLVSDSTTEKPDFKYRPEGPAPSGDRMPENQPTSHD